MYKNDKEYNYYDWFQNDSFILLLRKIDDETMIVNGNLSQC